MESINSKRIYTIATINGFSHSDVISHIAFEYGLSSTKDLNKEQYNQLINYLDKESQMSQQKTYVGNGRSVKTQYGEILNIGIRLSDLQPYVNEKGFVNLSVGAKKEKDKYDNTHAVWINDYKPAEKKQEEPKDEEAF